MSQVPVQPLLPQHCDERGQKRDQKARVQQASSNDDLARRVLLGGRNGGGFVWDGGVVEGEKDCTEESRRLRVGIRLKLRIDINDKRGADCREQARLRDQVRRLRRVYSSGHTNIKVVLRSSSYFLT